MNNQINPLFTGAYGYALPLKNIQGNRVYFPDIPVLRDKIITSVQVFLPDITVSAPGNKTLVGIGNNPESYITFCDLCNKEFISNYLLKNLSIDYRQVPINRKIVLQNSYIFYPDITDVDVTKYLYFIFYYNDFQCYTAKQNIPVNLQSVEVLIQNQSSRKFYFPDNRILVNRLFTNVLSPNDQFNTITSPSGYRGLNIENVFVTLIYQQDAVLDRVPLAALYQADKQFKLNMLLRVDFPSSYIEISENATITDIQASVLTFQY